MWDAWGGTAGIEWAANKLEEIDSKLSKFSSHKIEMSGDDEIMWLSHLDQKGEVVDLDLWEVVDVRWVEDPDTEEALDEYNFFKRFAEPNNKSNDDKGIYKIRYRYGPERLQSNSRIFCKNMIANRQMNVVYRREDIVRMGDEGINGQFAAAGESAYSIWKYKGGVACHHAWERVTFKRKQENGGKVLPLQPDEQGTEYRNLPANYKPVSNEKANNAGVPFSPPDWSTAQTKPIDMPNQGRKN
jgi:hypothetical protein